MEYLKIFVGTHGAAAIILLLADNMDFANIERIGSADDRTDIEVMFDVFDSDFEGGASFI